MSTSNAITKEDLKNVLNEVLPSDSNWTLAGTSTNGSAVSLPTGWKELNIVGKFGLNGDYGFSEFITYAQVNNSSQPKCFFGGNYTSANDYHNYYFEVTKTTFTPQSWKWVTNNVTTSSTYYVWVKM